MQCCQPFTIDKPAQERNEQVKESPCKTEGIAQVRLADDHEPDHETAQLQDDAGDDEWRACNPQYQIAAEAAQIKSHDPSFQEQLAGNRTRRDDEDEEYGFHDLSFSKVLVTIWPLLCYGQVVEADRPEQERKVALRHRRKACGLQGLSDF